LFVTMKRILTPATRRRRRRRRKIRILTRKKGE
jgi:hypothetical protein